MASIAESKHPRDVMTRYLAWLKALPRRPVFVAYPAAFDFSFVYWYLIRFTGENPFGYSDYGIGGQYVTRLLDRAALFRGHPGTVRTDKRPEFTSRLFMAWAQTHGICHILIQPGRPMQNGYIESFNGKFRG